MEIFFEKNLEFLLMEHSPCTVETTKDIPQPLEVLMGKFVCFLGGALAGIVALGTVSYLMNEYAAREEICRDDGDDGCLSADGTEASE